MEVHDLKPGECYEVLFEKDLPIAFKFLEKRADGKIICSKRNGKKFDFNSLPQHLIIRAVYPTW